MAKRLWGIPQLPSKASLGLITALHVRSIRIDMRYHEGEFTRSKHILHEKRAACHKSL